MVVDALSRLLQQVADIGPPVNTLPLDWDDISCNQEDDRQLAKLHSSTGPQLT